VRVVDGDDRPPLLLRPAEDPEHLQGIHLEGSGRLLRLVLDGDGLERTLASGLQDESAHLPKRARFGEVHERGQDLVKGR